MVDFWSMQCFQCLAGTQTLRRVQDGVPGDQRFKEHGQMDAARSVAGGAGVGNLPTHQFGGCPASASFFCGPIRISG